MRIVLAIVLFVNCMVYAPAQAQAQALIGSDRGIPLNDLSSETPFYTFTYGFLSNTSGVPDYDITTLVRDTTGSAGAYDWSGWVVHRADDIASDINTIGGGVLITRRHILTAFHTDLHGEVKFVGADNNVYTYTIVNGAGEGEQAGTLDIKIGTLSSEADSSIQDYAIATGSYRIRGLPIFACRHEQQVITRNVSATYDFELGSFVHSQSSQAQDLGSGDSGNPIFVPSNGRLLLIGTHQTEIGCPHLPKYITEINAILDDVGSYSATLQEIAWP